ncbi:tellurite resistance methyltransferase TehB [Castellaniella ginsengisoli]|uniref:Tellurite resistance methyltransferase TehB n=1 Tax=Castellaniella ginsengisoli TaxID=546114 RepID=A0AB39CFV9_9BURK
MQDLNSRYGLNQAHSEVVKACEIIAPCDAFDMGCSSGRNALYLSQLGFKVTAVDANPQAIATLQSIIRQESIDTITPRVYDIQQARIDADYGLIVCTVTLMFIDPSRVGEVLSDMRRRTLAGGYNLIVCAMDTADYPCPMNFPFTLAPGELSTHYQDWDLVNYNEDLGTMHNGAELQFATLLARKPG